jgi:DNA modification methylase
MNGRRLEQGDRSRGGPPRKPPLRIFPTTLWEYPSQHYSAWVGDDGVVHKSSAATQGSQDYAGATPSWVIWQLLMRYTREKDLIVDPMCGSGTTLDVARDLNRRGLGYDLSPSRPDIFRADARKLPLEDGKADFAFVDPPYSTHIEYSRDPHDIGALDAGGADGGAAYYSAMEDVMVELHRILKPRRYLGLYVSDSWRKRKGGDPGSGAGAFMPIGFELFAILRKYFKPVDIICVVRKNQKLQRGNWRKAAQEGNFFLRGFNYLFIVKKEL